MEILSFDSGKEVYSISNNVFSVLKSKLESILLPVPNIFLSSRIKPIPNPVSPEKEPAKPKLPVFLFSVKSIKMSLEFLSLVLNLDYCI